MTCLIVQARHRAPPAASFSPFPGGRKFLRGQFDEAIWILMPLSKCKVTRFSCQVTCTADTPDFVLPTTPGGTPTVFLTSGFVCFFKFL